MYHWVEDKDFLTRAYHDCADLVNQLVPNSQDLWEKENVLKPDFWIDVRETYLAKKNRYLSWQRWMSILHLIAILRQ